MAEDNKAKAGAQPKKNKMMIMLIMFGGAILVGCGVGVVAGMIFKPGPSAPVEKKSPEEEEADAEETPSEGGGGHGGGHGGGGETKKPPPADADYVKLDTITCNLDDPRLSRYVRVTIALVPLDKKRAEVQKLLDSKKPEVQNAITAYFSGCTMENIRGEQNYNRIRRELKDKISRVLWPGTPSMIKDVLFTEIQIS